jgi:hypothetical protein
MLLQPFLMNPRNKCVEINQVFCSVQNSWPYSQTYSFIHKLNIYDFFLTRGLGVTQYLSSGHMIHIDQLIKYII